MVWCKLGRVPRTVKESIRPWPEFNKDRILLGFPVICFSGENGCTAVPESTLDALDCGKATQRMAKREE